MVQCLVEELLIGRRLDGAVSDLNEAIILDNEAADDIWEPSAFARASLGGNLQVKLS